MTRVSTKTTTSETTITVEGNGIARLLFTLARAFGLRMRLQSITLGEPVQAIADRLAVEAIVERSRVP